MFTILAFKARIRRIRLPQSEAAAFDASNFRGHLRELASIGGLVVDPWLHGKVFRIYPSCTSPMTTRTLQR